MEDSLVGALLEDIKSNFDATVCLSQFWTGTYYSLLVALGRLFPDHGCQLHLHLRPPPPPQVRHEKVHKTGEQGIFLKIYM